MIFVNITPENNKTSMITLNNTQTQVRREFSYIQCHMIHLRVSLSFYGGAIRVYVTKKAKGIKKAKNQKDTKKAKKAKRQKSYKT